MSDVLTGLCPNCGSKLAYKPNQSSVMCYACDSTVSVSDISGNRAAAGSVLAAASMPFIQGFDNPESGIVFLENFFDTYNWEEYQDYSAIEIPEIREVISTNKMKNGATPEAWYLDFMGLAVPVSKKIEGLRILEEKIVEKYNPIDSTEVYEHFDSYRRIGQRLKDEEEDVIKQLEAAIKYAERFKLASDKLAAMKSQLEAIKASFKTIQMSDDPKKEGKVVDNIAKLPGYIKAREEYSKKIRQQFAERGINADATYNEAVQSYNTSENKSHALALFESIRDYADSIDYITKINQYFNFNNTMYRFFGKHFVYKTESYTEILNPLAGKKFLSKKKQKAQAAAQAESDASTANALSLYEVVDGKPAKEALIKGIEWVITCYGSKFYYIKRNAGIACFDMYTKAEQILDSAKDVEYQNDAGKYEIGLAKHAPVFFIKKKYKAPDITGCLAKMKKKKKGAEEETLLNPYSVLLVDMAKGQARIVINEMIDIAQRNDDKLFYTYAQIKPKAKAGCLAKKGEDKPKTCLMVCDLDKGTTKQVLDDACEINDVYKELIVYSIWKPNYLNKDLHVYNLETGADTIVERNVFNYFDIIDGKLYYTVGNTEFRPLVRNNFEGTERMEIMPNVENIIGSRGGWLYVQKGRKLNSVLFKVSADGEKRMLLCTQFKYFSRFTENYLYYVDTFNSLRVVRLDGKENRVIAEKVTKVFPAEEGLYYVREELVAERESALSLYKMDRSGRNVSKIVFNVDVVQNDTTTNTLYYSKEENIRFRAYMPGKEDDAHYEYHKINKFYQMDKDTGVSDLILTMGLPEDEGTKGCFGFGKLKQFVYEEAPVVANYVNKGLAYDDDEEEAGADAQTESNAPFNLPFTMPKGCAAPKGCSPLNFSKGAKSKGNRATGKKLNLGSTSLLSLLYLLGAVAMLGFGFIKLITSFRGGMF